MNVSSFPSYGVNISQAESYTKVTANICGL